MAARTSGAGQVAPSGSSSGIQNFPQLEPGTYLATASLAAAPDGGGGAWLICPQPPLLPPDRDPCLGGFRSAGALRDLGGCCA